MRLNFMKKYDSPLSYFFFYNRDRSKNKSNNDPKERYD